MEATKQHGGIRQGAGAPKKKGQERLLKIRFEKSSQYKRIIEETTPAERTEAILLYIENRRNA